MKSDFLKPVLLDSSDDMLRQQIIEFIFYRFMKKKTTAAAHNAQIKEASTTAPAIDIPELVLFLESLKQLIAAAGS